MQNLSSDVKISLAKNAWWNANSFYFYEDGSHWAIEPFLWGILFSGEFINLKSRRALSMRRNESATLTTSKTIWIFHLAQILTFSQTFVYSKQPKHQSQIKKWVVSIWIRHTQSRIFFVEFNVNTKRIWRERNAKAISNNGWRRKRSAKDYKALVIEGPLSD